MSTKFNASLNRDNSPQVQDVGKTKTARAQVKHGMCPSRRGRTFQFRSSIIVLKSIAQNTRSAGRRHRRRTLARRHAYLAVPALLRHRSRRQSVGHNQIVPYTCKGFYSFVSQLCCELWFGTDTSHIPYIAGCRGSGKNEDSHSLGRGFEPRVRRQCSPN